jgi:hypothetical protein
MEIPLRLLYHLPYARHGRKAGLIKVILFVLLLSAVASPGQVLYCGGRLD